MDSGNVINLLFLLIMFNIQFPIPNLSIPNSQFPIPDSLTPPKGATSVEIMPSFLRKWVLQPLSRGVFNIRTSTIYRICQTCCKNSKFLGVLAWLIFIHPKRAEGWGSIITAHLCANERVAVVYHGVIENIREEWLDIDTQTDGEIFLTTLNRYLEIGGISPLDALTITIRRLRGDFAVMVLFAKEDLFMVARGGCQLAIGVGENVTYFSSDSKALTLLYQRVMQLEEGSPTVLCSVQ